MNFRVICKTDVENNTSETCSSEISLNEFLEPQNELLEPQNDFLLQFSDA